MEAATTTTTRRPPTILLAALALIVVGSIGKWVSVSGIASKNGLEGDGVITLILAIIAAVLVGIAGSRGRPVSPIAVGACVFLALVIAIYDTIDVLGTDFGPFDGSVGWGLWLVIVGCLVALGSIVAARRASPA